jgi:hypothetical protein
MVVNKLNLSLNEPFIRQAYAKQGDTGRVFNIEIDPTPTENGTLRILRPDGVEVTADALKSADITPTESTDLVTFTALEEVPLTKLEVGLSSSQDLHGYDNPWPGGGGKNKFNVTAVSKEQNGITFTVNDDGSVKISGIASARAYMYLNVGYSPFPQGAFVASVEGLPQGGSAFINLPYSDDGTTYGGTYGTIGGATPSRAITISHNYLGVLLDVPSGSNYSTPTTVRVQIESGSEPTTWSPYSNICPIVPSNGVNLLPNVKAQNGNNYVMLGQTNPHTTSRDIYLTKGTYTLSTTSSKSGYSLFYCDNNGTSTRITSGGKVGTFDISADGYYAFYIYYSSGITADDIDTFQLEQGSSATPYVPYQGINVYQSGEDTSDYTTHSISLGRSVYGGYVDLVSGKLTITKECIQITSDSGNKWYKSTSYPGGFYCSWTNLNTQFGTHFGSMANGYPIKCSHAKTASAISEYAVGTCYAETGNLNIRIMDSTADQATWRQYLVDQANNGTPIEVWANVGTPIEVDLTPTQIQTLLGTNNIFGQTIREVAFEYDGILAELPQQATAVVGRCIGDVELNGVSTMPFTLVVQKNNQGVTP